MSPEDREALGMILERNGYYRTLVEMEVIQREQRVAGFVREGMSADEAEQYASEIDARRTR